MRPRTSRGLLVAFFAAYAIFTMYPGALPFNRIRPMILGLPFPIAWISGWVAASGIALWWAWRLDSRSRGEE
jgi:hypothetical protein